MKILLFTLVIYILKYTNGNFVCPIGSDQKPIDGAFRDPRICGIYYHCVNGIAYPQQCPPGFHFKISVTDCQYFICIQGSQSGCTLQKKSIGNKEKTSELNVKDSSSLLKTIIESQVPSKKVANSECQPNLNSTVGSSSNPSLYYNCVNGVAWPQQCPPETKFSPSFDFEKCNSEICRKFNGGSQPINGGWGEWSQWSDCQPSCGDGSRTRTRLCNNPPPSNGGSDCQGQSTESEQCTNGPCSQGGPAFMVSLKETTTGNIGVINWTSVDLNLNDMFNPQGNDLTIKTPGLYFFSIVATTTNGNTINMALEKTGLNIGLTRSRYDNAKGPETMSRSGLFILSPLFKPQLKLTTPTSLYSSNEGRETSWLGFHYKTDSYLFCGTNRNLPSGTVRWPIVSAMRGFRENSVLSEFRVESSGLYFINAGMLAGFTHRDLFRILKFSIRVLRNNVVNSTPLLFEAAIQTRLGTEQFSRSNIIQLQEGDVLTAHVSLAILGSLGPRGTSNIETYMSSFKLDQSLPYFIAESTDSTCNEFRRINIKNVILDSARSWNATTNEFIAKKSGVYYIEFTMEKYYDSKVDVRMFLNNDRVAISMKHSRLDRNDLFVRSVVLNLKENDKFHWENYGCINGKAYFTIINTSSA